MNIESELFVELSLLWWTLPLISIDDIELLVSLSMSVISNDVSVLLINSSLNIEDLSSFVGNESALSGPHLPPS